MTEQWTAEASTVSREASKPLTQIEIDQRVFDLYNEYCHGHIGRREFLSRAAAATIGRSRDGAGAVAALCAGPDDLLHGSAH
jgi:hypothetical protein